MNQYNKNNLPAIKQTDPKASFLTVLNNTIPELKKIAPKFVNIQRLIALALEACKNPLLASCHVESVIFFCQKCAEWGTDRVGAGGVWAVPFWSEKTKSYEMTPIPDWRLIIEKAKKAKSINHAYPEIVYQNDVFEYELGLNPFLRHVPARKNRGEIVAAYFVYILPDGNKNFIVMDWNEDIVPIRNRSKAWIAYEKDNKKTCPWVTDPGEMAKKTVVKRGLKIFEGASIELTQMIESDNVVNGYFDDRPQQITRDPIPMPEEIPAQPEQVQHDETAESSGADGIINQAAAIIGDGGDAVTQWAIDGKKIQKGQTWKNLPSDQLMTIVKSGKGFMVMVNAYIDQTNAIK